MCKRCDKLRATLARLGEAHAAGLSVSTPAARFIAEFATLQPGEWVDIPAVGAPYDRVANWVRRAKRNSGCALRCLWLPESRVTRVKRVA